MYVCILLIQITLINHYVLCIGRLQVDYRAPNDYITVMYCSVSILEILIRKIGLILSMSLIMSKGVRKKVLLVVRPLREGGGKGRTNKEKELYLSTLRSC